MVARIGPGPGVGAVLRCTLMRSGSVARSRSLLEDGLAERYSRSGRPAGLDAPSGRQTRRSDGRPAFGLGPIARVPTVAALAGPGMAMGPGRSPDPSGRSSNPSAGAAPGARSVPGARSAPGAERPGTAHAQQRPLADFARARAFGLPNLRRNVCSHFYLTGLRGAIPIHAPHLLKALVRQDATTSRCQLRGGVHLEGGYVNDVCLSPRFNQCVFYEEDLSAH